MAKELPTIIDKLVDMQGALSPPSGEKATAMSWDDLPDVISVFPLWVNEEGPADLQPPVGHWFYAEYTIYMRLLFQPTSMKDASRARKAWVAPVLRAFNAGTLTLAGEGDVHWIERYDFDAYQYGEQDYPAVTFTLRVRVKEDV